MPKRFSGDFKRFFLRGLAAFLPTLLTLAVVIYVFTLVQRYIGRYINTGVLWLIGKIWFAMSSPQAEQLDWLRAFWNDYLWWIGFALAIVCIYFFGKFVGSFVGRAVWHMIERAFFRMPVIKQIYPYIKQVTDFLLSEKISRFSRVVAVEYPRKGVWSLGLVTGDGLKRLRDEISPDLLTIFIPSSPTPVTGYTITVRRQDVIDLPLSIDEALKFTVSGGVIVPEHQQAAPAQSVTMRMESDKKANNEEL